MTNHPTIKALLAQTEVNDISATINALLATTKAINAKEQEHYNWLIATSQALLALSKKMQAKQSGPSEYDSWIAIKNTLLATTKAINAKEQLADCHH